MKSEELREIQGRIKEKYREQPDSAFVTLRAQGKIADGISCRVETGRALVEAGLHPATGGNGMLVCSGDMLLEALVACAGVTLSVVSTAIGIEMNDATIMAEGDLDFRGTLGVSKDVAVGFVSIRLSFLLVCDATEEQMLVLEKLTKRYCVVYQTLKNGISIETAFKNELK